MIVLTNYKSLKKLLDDTITNNTFKKTELYVILVLY